MSNELNKKIAQKGGMMIEALAMLGLIAVVTPTMYKKSAERTLEVEDINTATSMRSVMTAADSYVASHYGELVQEIASNEENNQAKVIGLDKLQPYLPYGFNANKLYDYNSPKVSVVRNGNNLTAFVLFPAKEKGKDGLGQERTVRIATLVGANGGYVNNGEGEDNTTAKGIGGIWNLSSEEFTKVFGSENPNIYSIVTASSDAINNTNTEEDTDKFLYRTDANGKWHNTMRADLFMGGFNNPEGSDTPDGYDVKENFSIRSVKSLIIGAETASMHDDTDAEGNPTQVEDNYGLYVTGANPNSFIQGSLEAANSQFKVDGNALVFGKNTEENSISENFKVDSDGNLTNEGSIKLGGVVKEGEEGVDPTYMIDGSNSSLNLMDERIYISGKDKTVDESLIINAGGTKGPDNNNTSNWAETNKIKYTEGKKPVFPVKVDSNMRVDGILATAQLDTQNIRAAELEVGSENIDDENKWLKVDADGIHGRNPATVSGEGNATKTNTVFDVKNGEVNIATGTLERNGNNFDTSTGGANNSFRMTNSGDDAGVELATSKNGVNNSFALKNNGAYLVSNQNIDINLNDSTNVEENDNRDIKLRNTKVQQQIQGSDVVFSSPQYGTTGDTKNTSVKVKGTNFQVSDTEGRVVLSVKGNDKAKTNDNDIDTYTAGTDEKANFAVHGETLFTSSMDDSNNSDANRKYLKVGSNYNNEAMVNIVQNDKTLKNVLTIDGDSEPNEVPNSSRYDKKVNTEGAQAEGTGGTVYIRKGMVEVMPRISENGGVSDISLNSSGKDSTTYSADKGYGVVKASRFVANNMKYKVGTKEVDPTKVPLFVAYGEGSGNKAVASYTDYNGKGASNPYDTYMVNPAYTSVMHDIKLTTRGGARLSDILPDFINKGIYVTSNTYPDEIKSLKFKIDGDNGIALADGALPNSETSQIILGNSDSWASPYLGFVPAPKCPPGYNRLVTMSPLSFMMSQAGQMQRSATGQDHPRGGYAYYTKNQVPENSAFTEYNNAMGSSNGQYIQQGFVNVVGADDVALEKPVVASQGGSPETVKAKTKGLGLQTGYYQKDNSGNYIKDANGNYIFEDNAQQHPYFLVSYGDTTPPLTIQQSTWLKTQMIPVGEGTASIGTPGTGYIKGWAALMGFVYDKATYKSIIDILEKGYKDSDDETHKQDLIAYDGSEGNDGKPSVYWNVFPVRRSTLEAYATVYCYFDRKGIMNELDDDAGKYVDQYDAVNDYKNTNTYDKHRGDNSNNSNQDYLERLNDPTLKYDEVW